MLKLIDSFRAREFRIASITTSVSKPRMFIIIFFHKEYPALVRVRAVFKKAEHSASYLPEFSIETIDASYELGDLAVDVFETKATSVIREYFPKEKRNGECS